TEPSAHFKPLYDAVHRISQPSAARLLTILLSLFYNDASTPKLYTLSLHDALPILPDGAARESRQARHRDSLRQARANRRQQIVRSEEHTSELQSPYDLVCRLLLEKKKPRNLRPRPPYWQPSHFVR